MLSRSTIRDLERALSEIETHRDEVARELAELEEQVLHLRGVLTYFTDAARQIDEPSQPAKGVRNEMMAILTEAGQPLHYRELYDRLLARGVVVSGKDPAKNVGAHLSNDSRFESLGNGRWGLAGGFGKVRRLDGRETVPATPQADPAEQERYRVIEGRRFAQRPVEEAAVVNGPPQRAFQPLAEPNGDDVEDSQDTADDVDNLPF